MKCAVLILAFLLLTSVNAHSRTLPGFEARFDSGKTALSTPEGKRYEMSLGTQIQAAMASCMPAGSTDPRDRGKFALVGYVAPSGRLFGVSVRPKTAIAKCFGQRLSRKPVPIPPVAHRGLPGFPISIEMNVVQ
jgi:hypothetical protein